MSDTAATGRSRNPLLWVLACGIAALVCGGLLVAIVARSVVVIIRQDERGVVISGVQPTGYRPKLLEPGLHRINPLVEGVRVYPVGQQTYAMASPSTQDQSALDDSIRVSTKDGQELRLSVAVTYSIDAARVIELHLAWQDRYQDDVVRPLTRGIARDTSGEFAAVEFIGPQKAGIEQAVTEQLAEKFAENYLVLIHFEITDVSQAVQ